MDPSVSHTPGESPRPESSALVLFGATGDLTHRKLVPALYSLFLKHLLPEKFAIIAFARKPKDDQSYRSELRASISEHASDLPLTEWKRFASLIQYHRGELDDDSSYQFLRKKLDALDRDAGLAGNRLYYLATPPIHFAEIAKQIAEAGLIDPDPDARPWQRIVVEKPFGSDLESARALNRDLRSAFSESQIYRIDHYLGKETVQNIVVLRFANRLFELLWSHLYVDNVQITVAETLGMEGRGAYFDEAGILRDMVQNHALQILSLVAMEPPVSLGADAVRDEKVKVLRSIRRLSPADVRSNTTRGQYSHGEIKREDVPRYLFEEGVKPDSRTETFAALRLWVDNWRWAGVPFYIRAGKRLRDRVTKIELQLRDVPDVLFSRLACSDVSPNRITIRIQPNEGVEVHICAKQPGPQVNIGPVRMHFDYAEEFKVTIPDAYERLLLNALLGDASLFARDDEVEEAWELITPILEAWQFQSTPPHEYEAGSWGPGEADALLGTDGRAWWNGG